MCIVFIIAKIIINKFNAFLFVSFENIIALVATFGDINAAVERLLALNQLSLS